MGLVCPYKEIGGRHSCCGAVDEGSRCSNAGCCRGASAILDPVQGVKGAGIGTAMVSVMAAAWIESLAGEPPCTTGAAIKNEKERQKEWIEFSSSLSLFLPAQPCEKAATCKSGRQPSPEPDGCWHLISDFQLPDL